MNTDYSPLPQNRSTRHQPKKDNAIIFCIRIAEQCTSYLSPDITGTVKIGSYPLMTSDHKGAFYAASQGNADTHGQDTSRGAPALGFSASNSNGIYGNSSTVRVPASYTLIIIRA